MTNFSTYHEPIRSVLGDHDPDIPEYDSDQLNAGMRTVLNLGKITGFAVSNDQNGVEPDLTPSIDATAYARLIWHTAKLFSASLTRTTFRTRAFSAAIGEPKELVNNIINEIYVLDNSKMSE